MARAVLALKTTARDATCNPTTYTAAAADGHAFDNSSGKVILAVKNGSGGSLTVTIGVAATVDGLAIADRTVTIADGDEDWIGPFPTIYNKDDTAGDTGLSCCVFVDTSTQTSVTYQAIKWGAKGY